MDWNFLRNHLNCAPLRSPSYEGVDWNLVEVLARNRAKSSPSYEGVDWNSCKICWRLALSSSPSYEGVDWNICHGIFNFISSTVLPLTREWIEIFKISVAVGFKMFSLLRGSGLKSLVMLKMNSWSLGYPSYEGVDWNNCIPRTKSRGKQFSLLRGSGLKYQNMSRLLFWHRFSLLRGSGLKCLLLFALRHLLIRSPSYEGVDWNLISCSEQATDCSSPSYEGVDWNSQAVAARLYFLRSPSYEGVDWNLLIMFGLTQKEMFSLLRGSGLKSLDVLSKLTGQYCSPSYEGVDWNHKSLMH